MIDRIARDTVIVCGVLVVVAAVWRRDVATPAGVAGGGILIGLAFWAIRGGVDAWIGVGADDGGSRKRPGLQLVKFFTRHVMLALAAYGMMVRLRIDPVAMLAGVSSLGAAVAVEAVRGLRWRRFP